jgi:ADP-ribosylglycohydrolase
MIGAITGDVIGSIYEFNNIKTKDFKLFGPECRFTDDTVLTVAVADWLLHDDADLVERLAHYTYAYPNRGYGGMYSKWVDRWDRQPYDSYGNGSAMRVSAVAWVAKDQTQALALAKASAEVTHSHPEGIKGAQATTLAIWLARQGAKKERIRREVTDFSGYDLTETVDEIREWYYFNETCQKTVPQAIICALDATDFEDAIRNAISIGGDSDTVAAITGSIAQAMFGIPPDIRDKARAYLPDELIEVVDSFDRLHDPHKSVEQDKAVATNQLPDPATTTPVVFTKLKPTMTHDEKVDALMKGLAAQGIKVKPSAKR